MNENIVLKNMLKSFRYNVISNTVYEYLMNEENFEILKNIFLTKVTANHLVNFNDKTVLCNIILEANSEINKKYKMHKNIVLNSKKLYFIEEIVHNMIRYHCSSICESNDSGFYFYALPLNVINQLSDTNFNRYFKEKMEYNEDGFNKFDILLKELYADTIEEIKNVIISNTKNSVKNIFQEKNIEFTQYYEMLISDTICAIVDFVPNYYYHINYEFLNYLNQQSSEQKLNQIKNHNLLFAYAYDKDWSIRYAVAIEGFCLNKLINDENYLVRNGVIEYLSKNKLDMPTWLIKNNRKYNIYILNRDDVDEKSDLELLAN